MSPDEALDALAKTDRAYALVAAERDRLGAQVAELKERNRFWEDAIQDRHARIADLLEENERLRKRLVESDRTATFYRYHKGGKS